MELKTFEKKIEGEIKKLTTEQKVVFAGRCAMMAVPLLGYKKGFSDWKENAQHHLLSVFKASFLSVTYKAASPPQDFEYTDKTFGALDYTPSRFYVANHGANTATVAAVNATTNNITKAVANAADYATKATIAGYASKAAVTAAAKAAANAYDDTKGYAQATPAAANAYARAAEHANYVEYSAKAAARATARAYNLIHEESASIFIAGLFSDISFIVKNQISSKNLIPLYGKCWNSFQIALKDEGCSYWAKLFEDIFQNGLQVDPITMEYILSIPEPIESEGAKEVGKYLEQLEKGAERLNEARVIILGDKGAGKTSIARKLVNPGADMPELSESTAGVDTTLWHVEEENLNIRIWDFAGHTVTHAVHQFFLSERCLYLMVYDGRTEERNRLEYWLDHMKNYGGDSQAIILVNKRDNHTVKIPINSLREKYPILALFEFDVKEDDAALNSFRDFIVKYINENPCWNSKKIPANTYRIKGDIEQLFWHCEEGKGKEFIERNEFNSIAKKYGIEDIDDLLSHLHVLGISLWYKEIKNINTLILNPEWISQGIYKIINWVNNSPKVSISIDDFNSVFLDEIERFPEDKYELLYELMLHYQIAYETENKHNLVIPHLLNEDRPEKLPAFEISDSLMCRYKANIPLPPDTISKFIVRHNKEIEDHNVWRYGVVLEYKNSTTALVREDDRIISVSVKGDHKTEYLYILRETLNSIFETYKSEKPDLEYRVKRYGELPDELEEKHPIWLPGEMINSQSNDGIPFYEYQTKQTIDLKPIQVVYKISDSTFISGQHVHVMDDHSQYKKSIQTTFNFNDCYISLQSSLNELAQDLILNDKKEVAEQIETAAKTFEKAGLLSDKEEIKKKGVLNKIKRVLDACEDENSKLHKTIKGLKSGVGIAQDIAKGYNDIAQWVGLPQVPKPFLKKED